MMPQKESKQAQVESGEEATTSSENGDINSWEQQVSLKTQEECYQVLQELFERRVRQFGRLQKTVDVFKEDLNMPCFTQTCAAVTQAFQGISLRVRHVEKVLQESSEKIQHRMAGLVREIQNLEKTHLEQRVNINEKIVKLALMDYELKKQKFLKKTIEDCDIEL